MEVAHGAVFVACGDESVGAVDEVFFEAPGAAALGQLADDAVAQVAQGEAAGAARLFDHEAHVARTEGVGPRFGGAAGDRRVDAEGGPSVP